MEVKKRKGYKTQEQQTQATKNYRRTKKGKNSTLRSNYKSNCKKFIKEIASLEELEELKKTIEEEIGGMKTNMKTWADVKDLVNLATDVNVDKDNLDKAGNCIVDIVAGKYKGFSVAGKIIFGEDEDILTIENTAEVYNPAE